MKDVVIVGAARTPIGCFQGGLAGHSAAELGAVVVKALLARSAIDPALVDEVILGQVLTAGAGQNPARQTAVNSGLPWSVSAITINDVCGSGLKALHLATQAIQCGEADVVIAGGQENMSQAPHVLTNSRKGVHQGDAHLIDSLVHDGLWDAFNDYHMGVTAENLAREYGISRELQDAYALASQRKARLAIDGGRFRDEIVPVIRETAHGPQVIDTDEQPRLDASEEGLATLPPSFDLLGSVTAGNASSINDGAAAVMMMSASKAQELGLTVMARIRAFASVGVDPALMGIAPVYATRRCLERVGWRLEDLDLIEANEAFAAQVLSVNKLLEWDERKVNVNGGAIALGHPIGASGCRILVSLVHEMIKREASKGLATLCIGGGQGVALAIERG
ncbi:acetyl-CoA C-acetyltransferase [Shimwellia blattae]|uniref:Putative acetyl-CoA acetyltransferase with thiolase domain n=1 Tax=Shimwellia blattae (strain ATCC 29907 / DSM 4481 / JCM 1650 / NBRC 105725 / CDC 9005-74) TaxID=630626 RepID=I2B5V4_SHIBC|nr:acetyl-CoA C-acetyltransferase [Shimwellia blattae]AFJ45908.1 putative acetyl-CoA acetyltransferase with thiolase domain [Shimwellia blattae DSM 4481 = NBRC 105725]GAB81667.1 putative acetyl-CoA acetyltransferase [Shimwellia blattae DSM 4481 = NBRC 105725]VDY63386.1 Acetyl-CoA acetyltransferase [Shimwellia blattae]VEC21230.1 Acetyl-CoA acetyltransferase [Shimwellia blattae]